jgi:hypothetical protein
MGHDSQLSECSPLERMTKHFFFWLIEADDRLSLIFRRYATCDVKW